MQPTKTREEVFDDGYAVPGWSVKTYWSHWQYKDELYVVRPGIEMFHYHGWTVAKIEDVRKHIDRPTGGS